MMFRTLCFGPGVSDSMIWTRCFGLYDLDPVFRTLWFGPDEMGKYLFEDQSPYSTPSEGRVQVPLGHPEVNVCHQAPQVCRNPVVLNLTVAQSTDHTVVTYICNCSSADIQSSTSVCLLFTRHPQFNCLLTVHQTSKIQLVSVNCSPDNQNSTSGC